MDVILLAAGIGKRAKLNYPKQIFRLGGIPILVRLINIFQNISKIKNIILTVIPDKIEYFENILKQYDIKNVQIIKGGTNRQQSVYYALQYVQTDKVIIHEVARPFITKEYIKKMIEIKNDNVVPIIDVNYTLYDIKKGQYPRRNDIKNVQLPQKFNTELLKEAHEKLKNYNFTDDSSLFVSYFSDKFINYIDGLEENIKITTPLDVKISEVIYDE